MSENNIFASRLYKTIKTNISYNHTAMIEHIRSILSNEKISSALDVNHPGLRVFLGQLDSTRDDRMEFFRLAGVTKDDLTSCLKEAKTIPAATGEIGGNVFNYLLVLLIKESIEANRKENDTRLLVIFLAVHFYSSLQYKYFKFYNENVMEYAVNSLTNKYILKQQGTILKMLDAIAWNSHIKYIPLLNRAYDKDIFEYFINLRTRLNGTMLNLKAHYEDTRKNASYINKASKDLFSEEELVESDSGRIENSTNYLSEEFIKGTTNYELLRRSIYPDVSTKVLNSVVVSIKGSENNATISKIFYLILTTFFNETKTFSVVDIRSIGFIAVMIRIFSRKNTSSDEIKVLRDLLDKLLNQHCIMYKYTKRLSTKSNYCISLYKYFLLFVQKNIR